MSFLLPTPANPHWRAFHELALAGRGEIQALPLRVSQAGDGGLVTGKRSDTNYNTKLFEGHPNCGGIAAVGRLILPGKWGRFPEEGRVQLGREE